ncbi:MAG: UDP-N-acetyl-D-galactosamine dehydrogenase [Sneathiella sp.]|jgi:UDP-N-acetyl-D-galactosamine dehydrogenase|uniref:nucleotide sugar dehydrogenase n=1 Tax=Sneathiella sp. TaxID=1964365 RepID=UPI000C4EDD0C|nr:nucleotide sugar dehydrogenase [Sneathiella sp.]MAL79159.1 UDP-N-acetyl-D-galactosamine dehydrogenase [Sneathiella sp.]
MVHTAPAALKGGNKVSVKTKISIVGLGYVGLPLAVALARSFDVIGYDVNANRVKELRQGHDRTMEIDTPSLRASSVRFTTDINDTRDADIHIVTVPTPVDEDDKPDLNPLKGACEAVGPVLKKGAIVVVESTVYPGVTEDVCGPILEETSGMTSGADFYLGYSPERINPGDKVHTVDKIIKVVSGQTEEVTDILADVYGAATTGGTYRARNIKTAEAAKVIENAQRDINIAFVNEATMIFQKLGISAYDVLETAGTKWNFLNFTPGLVGGHCIGVDPFYLAHRANEVGHFADLILTGRRINENMGRFIAESVHSNLSGKSKILVLGVTFKENVPDLRNTKVVDIIQVLRELGHEVDVHDPLADKDEASQFLDIDLIENLSDLKGYDAIVGAVAHSVYRDLSPAALEEMVGGNGLLADVKGIWRNTEFSPAIKRWQL